LLARNAFLLLLLGFNLLELFYMNQASCKKIVWLMVILHKLLFYFFGQFREEFRKDFFFIFIILFLQAFFNCAAVIYCTVTQVIHSCCETNSSHLGLECASASKLGSG